VRWHPRPHLLIFRTQDELARERSNARHAERRYQEERELRLACEARLEQAREGHATAQKQLLELRRHPPTLNALTALQRTVNPNPNRTVRLGEEESDRLERELQLEARARVAYESKSTREVEAYRSELDLKNQELPPFEPLLSPFGAHSTPLLTSF